MTTAILAIILAYYWTGLEKVLFDHGCSPIDRPAYSRDGSFWRKLYVGAIWPYACMLNQEFGWFLSCFLSSLLVIWITLALLAAHIGYFLTVLLIGTLKVFRIPFVSAAYTNSVSFIGGAIFALLAKIFRLRVPGAVERALKHQRFEEMREDILRR